MATLEQHRLFDSLMRGMDLTDRQKAELFAEHMHPCDLIRSLPTQAERLDMLSVIVDEALTEPAPWRKDTMLDAEHLDKFREAILSMLDVPAQRYAVHEGRIYDRYTLDSVPVPAGVNEDELDQDDMYACLSK